MRKNWYIWKLQRFVEMQWIPNCLPFEVLMSHICSCRPFYRNASRRIMTWGLYNHSTTCRITPRKKWGFFLQMCVIKYVTVCSYIKHSTVGNHFCVVDVVCICWLFRLGNVELCCRLCPGLKPTRATSLLLWAAVVRGWCIETIAFGSQKLISSLLSLPLSMKI